ncbi:hypothetical protein FH972_021571 [Carpinus fangiana]|uniref:BZIP domain-containing protein n=1 Tax=Carpinus fangiana TaxID=176857 RepID=A0A5N6KQA0_9ROSI|nr:hypothetical protein FH972_021571 [Carpinus fangiana]KAB8337270.1 hypothetical protein FH972_021571 [Carpinus fangiana]
MKDKVESGSPITHRRAQLREAQRAYQARKRSAAAAMEVKIESLKGTIADMGKVIMDLSDGLLASADFQGDQKLVQKLATAVQKTLALSQATGAPMELSNSDSARHVKAEKHPLQKALVTKNTPPACSPWTEVRYRAPHILVRHHLAESVFPHTEVWSSFAYRLHWVSLYQSYLALLGDGKTSTALGYKQYAYSLLHMPRPRLLRALRFMMGFKAVGYSDSEKVVALERTNIFQSEGYNLDYVQTTVNILNSFMKCCEDLSSCIDRSISSDGVSRTSYLDAPGVEQYLKDKGVAFSGSDEIIFGKSPCTDISTLARVAHTDNAVHDSSRISAYQYPSMARSSSWFEPRALFLDSSPAPVSAPEATVDPQALVLQGHAQHPKSTLKINVGSFVDELVKFSVSTGKSWEFPLAAIDAAIDRMTVTVH